MFNLRKKNLKCKGEQIDLKMELKKSNNLKLSHFSLNKNS